MEGARWDVAAGTIADSRMKELFPAMPVIYVKVIVYF
jgi:dynein heavy chain